MKVKEAYKVWSGFTKTLRTVVLKYTEEDLVIKTVYFGKFYISRLQGQGDESRRQILYQPPSSLASAVKNVAADSATIPYG